MTVKGKITQINEGRCTVTAERPSACEGCANAGICRSSCLIYVADNRLGARLGDEVLLEVGESKDLLLLCYIFLVPLAILFISAFAWSICGAYILLFSLPSILLWFFFLKKIDSKKKPNVNIVSIIEPSGEIR